LAYRIDKLSTLLGLPVEVTEISFHTAEDQTTWQQTMTDEAAQADAFEKMLTTYFSHPKVTAMLLWGFGECCCQCGNGGGSGGA
jgi:GH35 family endo-1,4-beta-xylanase